MTDAPDDEEPWLSVVQTAARMGLSRRKVMELIGSGEIETIRIPSKNGGVREHRIEPAEIKRFSDRYRQRAGVSAP